LGAAGAGAGTATTLTIPQTFVLSGTVAAVSNFVWRNGFNDLFPDYVAPPSVGSVTFDYLTGGAFGLGFRAIEAVGNPFSRAGWNTVKMNVAEANARVRALGWRLAGSSERAAAAMREVPEFRVGRLHAPELRSTQVRPDSVV
jgi:hypothetical protein